MKKNKKTLLWKLDGPGMPGPSYVFGTMHVKDQRAFYALEKVYECIRQCDSFATEFNLEEAMHKTGAELMDLPEGQLLSEILGPKLFKKMEKVFHKCTGHDLSFFETCQPILISNLISESILSKDMPHSLDQTLWNFARSQNKITLGVETFEEQIEILHKIPMEFQRKSLATIAKNFKAFRKQLLKMTALYMEADLNKLHRSARKSVGGMRKLMLYDRNVKMAERILRMAKEQTLFAAIGAGHLGGKKGVLRLFKQQGIKPMPVKLDLNVVVETEKPSESLDTNGFPV